MDALAVKIEKMLVVKISGQLYGLFAKNVTEVSRPLNITVVPYSPEYLHGVANLRGTIISVVDTARILGLEPAPVNSASRIVVCRHEEIVIGLIVDYMEKIIDVDLSTIEPYISTIEESKGEYIEGMFMDGQAVAPVLNIASITERFRTDLAK